MLLYFLINNFQANPHFWTSFFVHNEKRHLHHKIQMSFFHFILLCRGCKIYFPPCIIFCAYISSCTSKHFILCYFTSCLQQNRLPKHLSLSHHPCEPYHRGFLLQEVSQYFSVRNASADVHQMQAHTHYRQYI